MQATVKKIKSGKYTASYRGYVFTIRNEGTNVWTLSNQDDVEIYKCTTKNSLVKMLENYGLEGTKKLNEQQFCTYA